MSVPVAVVAALGPNYATILTVGATILAAVIAAGSAAGGFAAFRTQKTNAVAASAVSRANEATETANMWKERVDAITAEFTAYRQDAERDRQRAAEALHVAEHQLGQLTEKVATLEGIVTARKEIIELTGVVTALGTTVGEMMAKLNSDHQRMHQDHATIMAAIGGRRGTDA